MNKKSNLLLAALLAAVLAVLLITGVGIVSAQEEGPEEPAPQAQTPPTTMQTVYDILHVIDAVIATREENALFASTHGSPDASAAQPRSWLLTAASTLSCRWRPMA